jgi:hypothetical protein
MKHKTNIKVKWKRIFMASKEKQHVKQFFFHPSDQIAEYYCQGEGAEFS